MTYSYDYLANKAKNGNSIGKWQGIDVFPISKNEFENQFEKSNGKMGIKYYLIFDNGMKIIFDNKIRGTMDRNGVINDDDRNMIYYHAAAPTADRNLPTLGTYNMDNVLKEVDNMLKEACIWQD